MINKPIRLDELNEHDELLAIELAGGRLVKVGTVVLFQVGDDVYTQVAFDNKFLLHAALATLLTEKVAALPGGFQARFSLLLLQGQEDVAALAANIPRIRAGMVVLKSQANKQAADDA